MGAKALTKLTLTTAVAVGGTVTVNYPSGETQASLQNSQGGVVAINNNDVYRQAASGANTVGMTFGASNITITNNSPVAWPAGAELIASFGRVDRNGSYNLVIGTEANTAKAGNL